MLIAKLALDLEAKHKGIALWRYEDVPEKLWPVSPLSEMWGIGKRLEKRLNNLGHFYSRATGQLRSRDIGNYISVSSGTSCIIMPGEWIYRKSAHRLLKDKLATGKAKFC